MEPLDTLVAEFRRRKIWIATAASTIATLSAALLVAVWMLWQRLPPPAENSALAVVVVARSPEHAASVLIGHAVLIPAFEPAKDCPDPPSAGLTSAIEKLRTSIHAADAPATLVVIAGHDSRPLRDRKTFSDNRSLAAARASCLARLLTAGVAADKVQVLRVVAYPEHAPPASETDLKADRQARVILLPGAPSGASAVPAKGASR